MKIKTSKSFIITLIFTAIAAISCTDKNPLDDYTDPNKEIIKPTSTVVKIMTYNIFGARDGGLYKAADFDKLAEVIKAKDPDFVFLNEVDSASNRSQGTVHYVELAKRLGMNYAYAVAFKFADMWGGSGPGAYGDAVLSKHPILEQRDFNMKYAPGQNDGSSEKRSVCAVKSKIGGKELWLAATHLDHRKLDDSRYYQAQQLEEITSKLTGKLFLGGDFNAIPSSRTMQRIFRTFQHSYTSEAQYTFPSHLSRPNSEPTSLIDYILYRKAEKGIKCVSYDVVQNTASDHCAVIATFTIY